MNKGRINNIAAAIAVLALAGCTATPPVYSHAAPIMSADDAKAMIQVEVKAVQPTTADPVIVAAVEQQKRLPGSNE